MTTGARELGKSFDIVAGVTPVNLNTAGNTGKRVRLRNCSGVTIIVYAGVGTAASDLAVDLQEHNAATGGISQDLDIITRYYSKQELTLDGDETWSLHTQSAASEIADVGGAGTSAELENLVVIEVGATQLSDGFEWVSLNIPQPGATKLGCVIYLLHQLTVQRAPELLANPQA
jgi:hypothetical protein